MQVLQVGWIKGLFEGSISSYLPHCGHFFVISSIVYEPPFTFILKVYYGLNQNANLGLKIFHYHKKELSKLAIYFKLWYNKLYQESKNNKRRLICLKN